MTDPRVAFEAWMKTRTLCLTLDASVIDMEVERYMHEAWQAAIKHERGAAAKVCEDVRAKVMADPFMTMREVYAAKDCAAAIRARSET